jgi:hypothetical protein
LVAGTEHQPVARASGDGGAAAHLHGPATLCADLPADVVARPPDVVPNQPYLVPAANTTTNVVTLPTTSTKAKGRNW